MSRPAAWAVTLVLTLGPPTPAQPSHPLDLARGLRDSQLPDLALEYLADLAARTSDPDLSAEILLERAQARLAVAAAEPDEGKKDALAAEAMAEFDRFLATVSPRHPRRAEAATAQARATAVRARGRLARAAQQDDPARRAADAAEARALFLDAATRFGKAAAESAANASDDALSPARKAAVRRQVVQAEFDRAVNTAELARAYALAGGTDNTIARGKQLEEAVKLFRQVAADDPAEPLHWVALAWAAECERDRGNPTEAERFAREVREAAGRNPAAAAGGRQLRFFDLRAESLKAIADNSPAGLQRSRRLIETFLAEPASRTPSAEVAAARFYLATGKLQEARLAIKDDPKTKQPSVPGYARDLLHQAERDYRKLLETDTDYSARAARFRGQAIRLLVGDADKPPASYPTADECLMAAQVQLDKADEVQRANPAGGPELVKQGEKAAALLERVRELTPPRDTGREAADAQVKLVFAYLLADRPYQAAVLGEHLARSLKGAALPARAGYYALVGYVRAANKLDPDAAADDRRADRGRAVRVARLLDDRFPADPSTDLARLQAADLLLADGDPRGAYDLLGKVPAGSPWAARARGGQATAALALLRPQNSDPPLSPADRERVYAGAVAAVSGAPAVPASAPAADARQAVGNALRLIDLHFAAGPAAYPKAQQAAERAATLARSFTSLPAAERDEFALKADLAKLRAVYAQAVPLYQDRKYADALARLQPALADAAKAGPAVKPDQPPEVATAARAVDEFRRDRVVQLALQARIREGAADKAGELLDLLKRLGGSQEAVVAALEQLGGAVRPQADALRKEGKTDEADKLTEAVAGLFEKAAGQQGLSPRALVAVGRGLRENGRLARAVEVLRSVPAADTGDLAKRGDQLDDNQRSAVAADRLAKLELLRTYRQAGQFAEADAVLAEALGSKDKPGWAAALPDARPFRREAAHLLEAKAAAADPRAAGQLWLEARNKWTEQAAEFRPTLTRLAGGKRDPRQAVLVLLDLKALPPDDRLPKTPEEIRKGVLATPPAGWAAELFAKPKGADGKAADSPYVHQMHTALTRLEGVYKPLYFDLVYEQVRCIARGTVALHPGDAGKQSAAFARLAPQLIALEQANPDLGDDLKAKFAGLLDDHPPLKAEYAKLGGKVFVRTGQ